MAEPPFYGGQHSNTSPCGSLPPNGWGRCLQSVLLHHEKWKEIANVVFVHNRPTGTGRVQSRGSATNRNSRDQIIRQKRGVGVGLVACITVSKWQSFFVFFFSRHYHSLLHFFLLFLFHFCFHFCFHFYFSFLFSCFCPIVAGRSSGSWPRCTARPSRRASAPWRQAQQAPRALGLNTCYASLKNRLG